MKLKVHDAGTLEPPHPRGMIIREKEPLNLEMPFCSLDSFITPVEHFYVRCHHPVPQINLDSWRLKIEGDVTHPFSLSYEDLLGMETRNLTTAMECAGNGRAFLEPQRNGAQWQAGAVGNAEWTGVPLATLLDRAGLRDSVCEIILEGADIGQIKEPPRPAGNIHYSRSVPLAKATDDVLLTLQMNGTALTPSHGFPLRAVVPGWYGMAAVKWLTRIIAVSTPYHGYYQSIDYTYWDRSSGPPTLVPITSMSVKAQIARPGFAETVLAGKPYRMHGATWTSDADIVRVDVSTDGGTSWSEAHLLGQPVRHTWRLWEHTWLVPSKPGDTILMARATDSAGRTQPDHHHEDRGSYLIHHCLQVPVTIQ